MKPNKNSQTPSKTYVEQSTEATQQRNPITNSLQKCFLILGWLTLILGYYFYIEIRNFDPLFLGQSSSTLGESLRNLLPPSVLDSLPSFIHVLSLSFIHFSLIQLSLKNTYVVALFWIVGNAVYEILQSTLVLNYQIISGTYDSSDLFYSLMGGVVFLAISNTILEIFSINFSSNTRQRENKKMSLVVLLGVGTMLGCDSPQEATPEYMSYEKLRSSFEILTDHTPDLNGSKLFKENLLLIREEYEGINIFDNTDPKNPEFVSFLSALGSTEMEVYNGFLFVNSYVDLLVIDIRDLNNINLSNRTNDFFAYDPHQTISRSIDLVNVDQSKGVVIDYKWIDQEDTVSKTRTKDKIIKLFDIHEENLISIDNKTLNIHDISDPNNILFQSSNNYAQYLTSLSIEKNKLIVNDFYISSIQSGSYFTNANKLKFNVGSYIGINDNYLYSLVQSIQLDAHFLIFHTLDDFNSQEKIKHEEIEHVSSMKVKDNYLFMCQNSNDDLEETNEVSELEEIRVENERRIQFQVNIYNLNDPEAPQKMALDEPMLCDSIYFQDSILFVENEGSISQYDTLEFPPVFKESFNSNSE